MIKVTHFWWTKVSKGQPRSARSQGIDPVLFPIYQGDDIIVIRHDEEEQVGLGPLVPSALFEKILLQEPGVVKICRSGEQSFTRTYFLAHWTGLGASTVPPVVTLLSR